MSHFTVLVIGGNPEKQLQPYHEYECTGVDDEYVIDVDNTEEVEGWLKEELFAGKKGSNYDYEYDEEDAKENLTGYKKMSRSEYFTLIGSSIDNEIADYHGYTKKEGKWIRRTNPNKKWDWYQLGGRWAGFFKMKHAEVEAVVGEESFMGSPAREGYADQLLKRDIDFDSMRAEAVGKADGNYQYAMSVFGDAPVNETWDTIRDGNKDNIEEARNIYWAQPRCVAWQAKRREKDWPFGHSSSPDNFIISKEQYLKRASDGAVATFAVVKDGQWYEKGSMGRWACVSDEKDNWNEEFAKLLDSVSDDTLLSVYDCHI
jgi:hypothetical protein